MLTSQSPPSYTNAAYAASLKFAVGSGRAEGKHFLRTVRQMKLAAGLQTRVEQKNLDVRATAKTSRGEFVWINISARSSSGSVGKRLRCDALSDSGSPAGKEGRGFFFVERVETLGSEQVLLGDISRWRAALLKSDCNICVGGLYAFFEITWFDEMVSSRRIYVMILYFPNILM